MTNYLVTYASFNSKDYCIMIQAENIPHLLHEAQKPIYKRHERDLVHKVHEYKNS